jgi:hypothetical protein
MSAREKKHIPADLPHALDNAVRPLGHLFRRFTFGTAMLEQLPTWSLGHNFCGAFSFVSPVIPLHEVGVNFGDGPISGQGAGPSGAHERAGEDLIELQSSQPLSDGFGVPFALVGQW